MRPRVARTVVTLAAVVALAGAGALVACGSFSSAPAPVSSEAGASLSDAAPDVSDAGDPSCEDLFQDDFASLAQFYAGSQDAGPAVLGTDSDPAVKPPSLAASAAITRGKANYVNSSASHELKLSAPFSQGQRIELEYDLFLEQKIDAYGEVGCTLELKSGQTERTRLLLAILPSGSIDAKVDPADPLAMSLSKTVVISRIAGHYHVTTTIGATGQNTALVHYDFRDSGTTDMIAPLQNGIDRLRLVCGIDYANTDAAAPVTLRVWVDDVVVRRCVPKP